MTESSRIVLNVPSLNIGWIMPITVEWVRVLGLLHGVLGCASPPSSPSSSEAEIPVDVPKQVESTLDCRFDIENERTGYQLCLTHEG